MGADTLGPERRMTNMAIAAIAHTTAAAGQNQPRE